MSNLGKFLILFGLILAGIGLLVLLLPKISWVGRLPGDIVWRRGNFTIYFPLLTSLLMSIILSILLFLFRR